MNGNSTSTQETKRSRRAAGAAGQGRHTPRERGQLSNFCSDSRTSDAANKATKQRLSRKWELTVCPYCGEQAVLNLKGKWPRWECSPCQAWVGVHSNSAEHAPLGTLANARLRQCRMMAHAAFDPMWEAKMRRDGVTKRAARKAGYQWLAAHLGIKADDCHIALLDEALCLRVVEVCRPWTKA